MTKEERFAKQELANSKRIMKSATPKYTLDWYIKWIASIFVLAVCHYEVLKDYSFTI